VTPGAISAAGLTSSTDSALSVTGLSKTFGFSRVLQGVNLEVRAAEVHGLVGQNGSGKSTLIKILAGYHQPDPGAVGMVGLRTLKLGDSRHAFATGLRFVHQDLGLAPALNALDNLALTSGYRRSRSGTISWRRVRAAAEESLGRLGYDFDISVPVSRLSASERTGIAIARALDSAGSRPRVLVMDEPTAALPVAEVDRLFQVLRTVLMGGVAIVYVSHRFSEVLEICDRVTVLRDGRNVATRPRPSLDQPTLIDLTIGRALPLPSELVDRDPTTMDPVPALKVRSLAGRVIDNVDLDICQGEIVGVAGLTGSGRDELADLIFGVSPRRGQVIVGGEVVPSQRPDLSMRRGMALVPAERLLKAGLGRMTVRENITIGNLRGFLSRFGLKREVERQEAQQWIDRLDIVPKDTEAPFVTLSGGNQQKAILARVLRLSPRILVLDEPTQGVDVGARAAIHDIVRQETRRGTGVLLISADSEELISLADRVAVLVHGRIAGMYSTRDMTPSMLTELTV